MSHINIEIKAKTDRAKEIRDFLKQNKAYSVGTDHQIDTYFKVQRGRLKLREGNIENYLIYYERNNQKGPKQSKVSLFKVSSQNSPKDILKKSLGVLAIVDKRREIYFIKNVKFHIDKVKGLGDFVEIEAIDGSGKIGKNKLLEQCSYYLKLFKIDKADLLPNSYSDLLIKK